MPINLEYLRIFYYVATQRNISRAAQKLFLSQPTVSNELRALEKQLGFDLFYRLPRGVELTTEGKYLYNEIAHPISSLIAVEGELKRLKQGDNGAVRVSYNSASAEHMLSGVIAQFQQEYPQIAVLSCKIPRHMLHNSLENGVIDCAIVLRPKLPMPLVDARVCAKSNAQITEYLLNTFTDKLVVGEKYSFLTQRRYHTEELGKYPLIFQQAIDLNDRSDYVYNHYAKLFGQDEEMYARNIAVCDIDPVSSLVKNGVGLGVLPSYSAEYLLQRYPNQIFPVALYESLFSFEALLHHSKYPRPSLAGLKFIEYILSNSFFSPVEIKPSI